jgi:diamine N-acetyltransferase
VIKGPQGEKMKHLEYRKITKENFYDIVALSKTLPPKQQECVANNAYSIAEGSVHSNAYYRGIYKGETPVGFFMISIPNEESRRDLEGSHFFLWRFMIAYEHQNKHYGTEVLDHIVDMGRSLGFKELLTSCHIGDVSPYDFYINYGFIDTGKVEYGEQVLRLEL